MDPKRPSGMLLAPSGSSAAMSFPARTLREVPPVDERLVEPESREQLVRGRRVLAMPANPEHGDRHFELDYVIRGHVGEGYVGSTDLLTRAAVGSDFATDTCVRRRGKDPVTGARYLEELAFEVVNEQSLRDVTDQAEDLVRRGVRRVVAIFVKKGQVCEWSAQRGAWVALDPEGTFSDATLARPLRVKDLLDAAEADNAVARALLAKDNPVLVEARMASERQGREDGEKRGLAEGEKKGLEQGIEAACDLLGIDLGSEQRARMSELDGAGLAALLAHIRVARRWP